MNAELQRRDEEFLSAAMLNKCSQCGEWLSASPSFSVRGRGTAEEVWFCSECKGHQK